MRLCRQHLLSPRQIAVAHGLGLFSQGVDKCLQFEVCLDCLKRPGIRHLRAGERASAGQLRVLARERGHGEFIVHAVRLTHRIAALAREVFESARA
jgi:hypothetical protein